MLNSRTVLSVVSAGALALAVSACGSSSSSATAAASAGPALSSARYQARLNFAKCLRAHGVDVPDPSPGGGPAAGGDGSRFRQITSSPNFRPALQACQKQLGRAFGFASLTPAQRAQFQQDAVKFAQCMRAHNIDIPDPTSNGVGGFGIFRELSPSVRNSPAFQSAFTACQSNLPRRAARLAGAGVPGGPPPGA